MKKNLSKILSIVLISVICLTFLPFSVSAEEYVTHFAAGKPCKADSAPVSGLPAEYAVDGIIHNGHYWQADANGSVTSHIIVDLEEQKTVNTFSIHGFYQGSFYRLTNYAIYGSNDPTVFEGTGFFDQTSTKWNLVYANSSNMNIVDKSVLETSVNYRYFMLHAINGDSGTRLVEWEINYEPIVDVSSVNITNVPTEGLGIGNFGRFLSEVYPANATWPDVEWTSSAPDVLRVDRVRGDWYAVSEGTATVTVASEKYNVSDSFSINVVPVMATSVEITNSLSEIELSSSYTLSTDILPFNTTDKSVTWTSSKPNIISVKDDGTLLPLNLGSSVITATAIGGASAQCVVEVVGSTDGAMQIDGFSDDMLKIGETGNAKVVLLSSGDIVSGALWSSSDNSVLTVDSATGNWSAVGIGQAIVNVSATINNTNYSTQHTIAVTNLNISPVSASDVIRIGETGTMDDGIESVIPGLTWESSNSAVFSINATTGAWTAISSGTATVTAKNGIYFDTYNIVVYDTATATFGLESNVNEQSLGQNVTVQLKASNFSNNIGALDLIINYDANILEVIPYQAGTEAESLCQVTSTAFGTGTTWDMWESSTGNLRFIGSGEDVLSLSPDSPLLTLNFKIKTGISDVSTVIGFAGNSSNVFDVNGKAVADTAFNTCSINILQDNPVASITISNIPSVININSTGSFTAAILPENASNKSVEWTSNNSNIIEINSLTGEWSAIAQGIATITATAKDGSGVTGSVTLTVSSTSEVPVLLGDVNIDGSININDALLVFKHILEKSILTGNAFEIGDVNQDGYITILDAIAIFNHIAQKEIITTTIGIVL